MKEYYGANKRGRNFVNKALSLEVSGKEQDWEIEFADPDRLVDMLSIGHNSNLLYDQKAALALLIIASAEMAYEAGNINGEISKDIGNFIKKEPNVIEEMKFFWLTNERALDTKFVEGILQ